ncbi:MAG TPA: hypothetical protein VF657_19825 [Actinoplanes sp.]|jgi:IS30 family transposase
MSVHTAEDLTAVADELNNRHRESLDWAAPAQLFIGVLTGAA